MRLVVAIVLSGRQNVQQRKPACPPGQHRPSPASSTCVGCSAGRFQSFDGEIWLHVCERCAPGRTAPASGSTECGACPAGQHSDRQRQRCSERGLLPGLVMVAATAPLSHSPRQRCPRGQFNHWSRGVLHLRACLDCPTGKYQTVDTSSSWWNTCALCPAGKYSDRVKQNECEPCWVLRAVSATRLQPGSAGARACAATFAAATRRHKRGRPLVLAAGGFGREEKSGMRRPAARRRIPACGAGRYGAMVLQTTHDLPAVARAVAPHWAWRVACHACPVGRFQPQDPSRAARCKACPGGQHAIRAGSKSCSACAVPGIPGCNGKGGGVAEAPPAEFVRCHPGKFARRVASITDACLPCPRGKFKPAASQSPEFPVSIETRALIGCIACPTGKFSADLNKYGGRSQCSLCRPAPLTMAGVNLANFTAQYFGLAQVPRTCMVCATGNAVQAVDKRGAVGLGARCAACSPGEVWTLNVVAVPYEGTCSKCPRGRFAGRRSAVRTCTLCPDGKHQAKLGGSSCRRCPRGKFVRYPRAPDFCYDCSASTPACARRRSHTATNTAVAATHITATAIAKDTEVTVDGLEKLLGSAATPITRAPTFTRKHRNQQQQQQQQQQPTPLPPSNTSVGTASGEGWLQAALSGLDSAVHKIVQRRRRGAVQAALFSDPSHASPSSSHLQVAIACAAGHHIRNVRHRAATRGTRTHALALACMECPPSRFQSEAIIANRASDCKLCPLGLYQPDHGAVGCKLCPAGKHGVRMMQVAFCDVCAPGRFSMFPGARMCVAPTPAPAPTSSPTPEPTTFPTPMPTPLRTSVPSPASAQPIGSSQAPAENMDQMAHAAAVQLGMDPKRVALLLRTDTARETPSACAPGRYRTAGHHSRFVFLNPLFPHPRAAASISELGMSGREWLGASGSGNFNGCRVCPAGMYGRAFKCTAEDQMLDLCDAGGHREGEGVCERCPRGKFQAHEGKQQCWMCPAGKLSVSRAQTDAGGTPKTSSPSALESETDGRGNGAVRCWVPPAMRAVELANSALLARLAELKRQANLVPLLQQRINRLDNKLTFSLHHQSLARGGVAVPPSEGRAALAADQLRRQERAGQRKHDQWREMACWWCMGRKSKPCLMPRLSGTAPEHIPCHDGPSCSQKELWSSVRRNAICGASDDLGACPQRAYHCTVAGATVPSTRASAATTSAHLRLKPCSDGPGCIFRAGTGAQSSQQSASVTAAQTSTRLPTQAPQLHSWMRWRAPLPADAALTHCPEGTHRWWCGDAAPDAESRAAERECLSSRLLACFKCPRGSVWRGAHCSKCASGEEWQVSAVLRSSTCVEVPRWRELQNGQSVGANAAMECPSTAHQWDCAHPKNDHASIAAARSCRAANMLFCMRCPTGSVWHADYSSDFSLEGGVGMQSSPVQGHCTKCAAGSKWAVDARQRASVCLICSLEACV